MQRRCRRNRDDEFDADDFRRQSAMIVDDLPETRTNTYGATGRGPRPPTMIERHYANLTTTPGPSFGALGANNNYNINPGQFMPAATDTQYANGNTFYNNPLGQTPVVSPASADPFGSTYDEQGRLLRSPSNGAGTGVAISRGKSLARHAGSPPPSEAYTDMSRESVTPFQAAQYAAISRQLNIQPTQAMPQTNEDEEEGTHVITGHAKSTSDGSPFDDPRTGHHHGYSVDEDGMQPARASSEFHLGDSRITSIPPMTPVLNIPEPDFASEDYTFPVSPSPLRSSFNISSTNVSALPSPITTNFATRDNAGALSGSPLKQATGANDFSSDNVATRSASKNRPMSSYEDDDAYGGF